MINIFKGDSTIFADNNKFITFNIDTKLNLDKWKAIFILGSIKKYISDISSKSFEIVLTSYDTSTLSLGEINGELKLIDNNGNIKTISNTISFNITDKVLCDTRESINLKINECPNINVSMSVGSGIVSSINGKTGDVTITYEDIDIPTASTEDLGLVKVDGSSIKILDGVISSVPNKDYSSLENKPQINSIELNGNKTLNDLNIQPKGDYALTSDIPRKLSELQNDEGFIKNIPTEYVTESELVAKNYVTNNELTQGLSGKQNKGDYALKSELPTKVSQLQNDSKYITEQELVQKNYINNTQFTTGLNTKADKVNEIKDLSSISITLENAIENTVYKYGTLSSLTINNIPNTVLPITFIFTCASDKVSVNLPLTLESINVSDNFEIGKKYVIAIENNIAVMGCVK